MKNGHQLRGILEQIPLLKHYKSYIKFIQRERMTILNLSILILKFEKLLVKDFQGRVRNVLLYFQKRNQSQLPFRELSWIPFELLNVFT